MNRFKMIISFFSTIPVKNYQFIESELGKGIRLVPLVGVIIGLLLGSISIIFNELLDKELTAFLILVFYIFLTGGLHLDGVADTCDGIFSHRSKDRILEIMKDSRIGAFGVISLIILLLGYWVFLSKSSLYVIFLFPVIGRSIALFTCRISTYARGEGFGNQFIIEAKNIRSLIVLISYIIFICIGSAFLYEFGVIIALVFTFLFIAFITKRINQKLGGITGDVIGFTIEISQLSFLVFAMIGEGFL